MCLYVQSCGSMLYSWTLNVLLIFSLEDLSNGESEILKLFHCYYISPFMPFSVYLMRLIGIIFSALNIYNYYVLLTSCTLTKMLQPHYGQRSREAHCRSSPLPPLLQIQSLSLIPSSVADNLLWPLLPLCPHLQQIYGIFYSSLLSLYSLLCPRPQLQQAFPRNLPAKHAREAGRSGNMVGKLLLTHSPFLWI